MVRQDIKEKSKLTVKEWREYTQSVWVIANVKNKVHPAVFPEEIPRRLIKLFSFVGDTVLDPFAGIGTTLFVANSLGRHSIGIDIYPKYIQTTRRRLSQQFLFDNEASCKIYLGDARDLSMLDDNSINLIVTSPPYWNKVKYGQQEKDLANIDDYFAFIAEMKKVFEECYRVLKPKMRMCIVTANVHEATKQGLRRFPLESDYILACREVGFFLVSEVIWYKGPTGGPWGVSAGQRPIFGSYPYPPNFLFMDLHEYIPILKKPGD